jgi:hypothetical protein
LATAVTLTGAKHVIGMPENTTLSMLEATLVPVAPDMVSLNHIADLPFILVIVEKSAVSAVKVVAVKSEIAVPAGALR